MALTPLQEKECQTLKALFNEKSTLSQREFVKKYDLGTPANLGQYLNGRRPLNITIASKVAAGLGIKVSDFSPRLASEIKALKGIGNIEPVKTNQKKIPLLSSEQAGLFTDRGAVVDRETCISNGDFIYGDNELSDDSFAFKITGDSMTPTFTEGDIVIIDPSLIPQPGDFVVAQRESEYTDGIETTFKKYRPKGINKFGQQVFELVPLNIDYPTIYSDREKCTIIGVMVEHRRSYRRNTYRN